MKRAASVVLLLFVAGCSVSIPTEIKKPNLPWEGMPSVVKAEMEQCVDHLNDDRLNAKRQRNLSDALAISGGATAAVSSGLTGVLAAVGGPEPDGDLSATQIAAISTGVIGILTSIIAVGSKLAESPAVPLRRHAFALTSYHAGLKAANTKAWDQAMKGFTDCQSDQSP